MKKTTAKAAVKAPAKTMPKVSLHKTGNDTKAKEKVIDVLNHLLADSLDLALATKQAHWNMRGANFIGVHEMVDGFNGDVLDAVDSIAERIVQLGGTAFGTVQNVAAETCLAPYPTNISTTTDHLKELVARYASVANQVRKAIDDGVTDEGTANIITDYSNMLDKALWFMEAHIIA